MEAEIKASPKLNGLFGAWTKEQQEAFLDFCSGARGVKMLHDSFFKIFNPDTVPERLNRLLSLLLGQDVKILTVLPNESSRIADEGSLLIVDIVVRMEDGSIANVEAQKIGYMFPGERAVCHSADLLWKRRLPAVGGRSCRPSENAPRWDGTNAPGLVSLSFLCYHSAGGRCPGSAQSSGG